MDVRLVPGEAALPGSGGVRQHCQMLRRFVGPLVTLTDDPGAFTHVQSSYTAERCDVYTCHGGFLPAPPIPAVVENLHKAKRIISVAKWIVNTYFPDLAKKTVVIPNGVCLADWDAVPEGESSIEPGYILVKGYHAWPEHYDMVLKVVNRLQGQLRFVLIGCPSKYYWHKDYTRDAVVLDPPIPEFRMARIIKDCAAFISPSSEVNPVMAMEAMACRKPVFGLDFHGNREVLPPGSGDSRYSNADELIELIVGNMPYVKTIGDQNRDWVSGWFNWETLARDILAVYEDVARGDNGEK